MMTSSMYVEDPYMQNLIGNATFTEDDKLNAVVIKNEYNVKKDYEKLKKASTNIVIQLIDIFEQSYKKRMELFNEGKKTNK